jgi:uncharacterized protein (DUF2126 family)
MGGEPTFVSIDDFESDEWNTAAVGPTKRALADELIRGCATASRRAGFLHYGQGKWYPGESLPRWTFSLYWRRDGKPIWGDAALSRPRTPIRAPTADGVRGSSADHGRALGVEPDYRRPAYEDPASGS